MKSGQVLILVLLTVIVVLTIGLSVASRNITNLRTTTQTEQSQRAFTAAEGGIEDVLSQIGNYTTDHPEAISSEGDTRNVPVGNLNATVNVKASTKYDGAVSLGDVLQIDLGGVNANSTIQIDWALQNTVEVDDPNAPASLEVTQIYNGAQQERYYFRGDEFRAGESSNEGFTPTGSCVPSDSYEKCALITTNINPTILRIKPFWTNTTVRVYGDDLPIQIYDVTSTAQSEIGVTRSVQVTRSVLPRLPAVFDYVLFSETDIIK